jgi:cell division protein ZapA
MKDRLVRFNLFGQEFAFYSDAPEAEVNAAIELLRQELEGDEKLNRSTIPSSKVLVLGCLRLAAKYVQKDGEYNRFRQSHNKTLGNLIEKIASTVE